MAGTINLSLSQQLDDEGSPLAEGRLYFYRAGTVSTPQNAFYDADLTLPLANPYILDASGRIPQFFLADGSIKVVLIDRHGNTQISADNILVIGPSGGGGGGGSVDPTTILQTGDVKYRYGSGTLSGFVRLNSRTIGSATSGATERANSDCQALFLYLWATDTNLTVSSGRGVSAAADWAANKTITLPDGRARMLAGLADMGNSNSGSLANNTFLAGNAITLGSALGGARATLLTANLPAYTPTGSLSLSTTVSTSVTTSITDPQHTHNVQVPQQGATLGTPQPSKFFQGQNTTAGTVLNVTTDAASTGISASSSATSTATPTGSFSGIAQGGSSTAFDIFSPALLVTLYVKL